MRAAAAAVPATVCPCRRNGTTKWVFKNASIYKIAGHPYDYEDITVMPDRMDIKAGNAVIHVIDTLWVPCWQGMAGGC